MDNGQDPQTETVPEPAPAPATSHEAGPWNVHRATLLAYSHEVGGVRFIGGAGLRLDEEVRRIWRQEAHQLVQDLIVALSYLPDETIRAAAGQVQAAADNIIGLRGHVAAGVRDTGEVPVLDEDRPRPARPRRHRDRDDAVAALADVADDTVGVVVTTS